MDAFTLVAKLVLDSTQYDEELGNAKEEAGGLGSAIKKGLKIGGAAVAAATTAAVGLTSAFVKGTAQVAEYGDHIDKMSQKMGMSAEAYQEWDAIMQHSGTTIDTMQAGMKTLANAVESGNKAFERLGMSQEEIAGMSNEELFSATITALQNVENETERTYLAGQLLGRGATELGALLNTSAEDTEAMRQKVHELGGVMSDEAVKAAAAYQDSLQDMKTAFGGLSRNLVTDFLPSVTTVMDGLAAIFSGDSEGGIKMISDGIDDLITKITGKLPEFIDLAFNIIDSLVSALIDNLPKLVEMGTQLLVKLIVGIIQHIPQLIAAVPEIIKGVVTGLKNGFPTLKEAGKGVINAIKDGIMALIRSATQWGRDLIDNFVSGIKAKIGAVVDAVSGVARKVRNFLGFSEPEEGALSNFHTYAPDMMKLFAKGVKDNAKLVTDEVGKAFDFKDMIVAPEPIVQTQPVERDVQPINITVQSVLDGKVLGESVYRYQKNRARATG